MPKTEETETERIKNIFDFDSFELWELREPKQTQI